jgi:hypothetical protein
VKQAPNFERLVFDPFSFQQDGLHASEAAVSERQIGDGLVIAQMVVVYSTAELARELAYISPASFNTRLACSTIGSSTMEPCNF